MVKLDFDLKRIKENALSLKLLLKTQNIEILRVIRHDQEQIKFMTKNVSNLKTVNKLLRKKRKQFFEKRRENSIKSIKSRSRSRTRSRLGSYQRRKSIPRNQSSRFSKFQIPKFPLRKRTRGKEDNELDVFEEDSFFESKFKFSSFVERAPDFTTTSRRRTNTLSSCGRYMEGVIDPREKSLLMGRRASSKVKPSFEAKRSRRRKSCTVLGSSEFVGNLSEIERRIFTNNKRRKEMEMKNRQILFGSDSQDQGFISENPDRVNNLDYSAVNKKLVNPKNGSKGGNTKRDVANCMLFESYEYSADTFVIHSISQSDVLKEGDTNRTLKESKIFSNSKILNSLRKKKQKIWMNKNRIDEVGNAGADENTRPRLSERERKVLFFKVWEEELKKRKGLGFVRKDMKSFSELEDSFRTEEELTFGENHFGKNLCRTGGDVDQRNSNFV